MVTLISYLPGALGIPRAFFLASIYQVVRTRTLQEVTKASQHQRCALVAVTNHHAAAAAAAADTTAVSTVIDLSSVE